MTKNNFNDSKKDIFKNIDNIFFNSTFNDTHFNNHKINKITYDINNYNQHKPNIFNGLNTQSIKKDNLLINNFENYINKK